MSPHPLHITGIENENCDCEQCLSGSPSKKPRRGLTFIPSPPESQPIVKGNNRYGAKGTIRCLACQRRKGKCEFPPDKPDQACEHCKRRGLRCGDKLPTERKRQLTQSQDDHSFVRTIDPSWVPTPQNSQAQYRYTDEPRQYPTYVNGITPRPVAPAMPSLPDPRPSVNYVPRPYHPIPVQRPHPVLIPQGADLVRLIETQIAKISLSETFAVARCLASEHGLVGNPYISDVTISRKNQEFSRGDSWFNVQWLESGPHGPIRRSINLRFEPGRQVCTSHSADDQPYRQHPPPQPQLKVHIAPRQDSRSPMDPMVESPTEMEPPKQMMNWSPGLVGDLFDKAAVIVDDQGRSQSCDDRLSQTPEQTSTALWPKWAWNLVLTSIWGVQDSKSAFYAIGIPHATIGVVVERCKSIVNVFLSEKGETPNVDSQQFIEHAPKKKRVTLKTLAKVLSHFSALKHRKPGSAGESIKVVEEIVAESAVDFNPSPLKREFAEIDNDYLAPVKTERSMSNGSSLSGTTNNSSVGYIKMEIDPPNTVDEETSTAASILNGVSMDHRTVGVYPPMHSYSTPFWSQGEKVHSGYHHQPHNQWLYNHTSQQASFR